MRKFSLGQCIVYMGIKGKITEVESDDYKGQLVYLLTLKNDVTVWASESELSVLEFDNYITEDIDFTGCDPHIASIIKKVKSVKCNVYDSSAKESAERWVLGYVAGSGYPYITSNGERYAHAIPIEEKKVVELVKPVDQIIAVLIANGYKPEKECWRCHNKLTWTNEMFEYCGKEKPKRYSWKREWIDIVEVD